MTLILLDVSDTAVGVAGADEALRIKGQIIGGPNKNAADSIRASNKNLGGIFP